MVPWLLFFKGESEAKTQVGLKTGKMWPKNAENGLKIWKLWLENVENVQIFAPAGHIFGCPIHNNNIYKAENLVLGDCSAKRMQAHIHTHTGIRAY